jgi:hypothetical protein
MACCRYFLLPGEAKMSITRLPKFFALLIGLWCAATPLAHAGVSYAGASGTFAQIFNSNPVEPCVSCHHSSLVGSVARNSAPTGVNFDTYAWVSAPLYNNPASLPTTNASQAVFMVDNEFMPYDLPSFTLTPLSGTLQTLMVNWGANGYPNIDTPDVTTVTAFSIGQTSVTLRGSVDPGGATATLRFRYNTDNIALALGTGTLSTNFVNTASTGGNGVAQTLMDVSVTGLICNTLYYYRGEGTNSAATGTGSILNFTTSACSPPVIGVDNSSSPSYTENAVSGAIIDSSITITDADSTQLNQATVSITGNFDNSGNQDQLVYSDMLGITGSYVSATGILTLTGTTSLANYISALQTVRYLNSSEDPSVGTRTITFRVRDTNNTLSNMDTVTVAVVAVNDVPSLAGSGGTLPYTENASATTIDNTITITDLDDTNLNQATIQIVTGCNSSEDRIEISAATCTTNGITCTPTLASCLLTLTVSQPLVNYRNVLRAVTYRNLSDNPDTTSRTVRMQVRDDTSGLSNQYDKSISVTAVNDAPVISGVDNTPTYTEAGPAVTIDSSISVADPDSTCTQATIDLSTNYQSSEDELAYAGSVPGISAGAFNSGTGTLTLSGTVACSDYGTALSSVTYINDSLNPNTSARTVVFQVTDSSGGALSNAPSTTITVSATGTAPTVSNVDNVASYTENGSAVAVDSSISISDPDSTDLNRATVSITNNFASGQDVLSYGGAVPAISLQSYAGGVLTLTGTATLAQYETALESVTYSNSSDNPSTAVRTIEYVVRDNPSNISSTVVTTTLSVSAVNDAPSIANVNNVAAFVEDVSGPVVIDPSITLNDAESNNLNRATVSITNNFASGEDQLIYPANLHGVTVLSNVGGVMTLTGTASLAQYEEVLESVQYNNTSNTPDTSIRTLEFAVRDAGSPNMTSSTVTTTLSVTASNDAPVIGGVDAVANYIENAAAIVIDSGVSISDVDSTQINRAIVSITGNFASGQDLLVYPATLYGVTVSSNVGGVLILVGTATLAQYEEVLESVRYQNSSDAPSTLLRTISMAVRDAGNTSSVADTTTLTVTAQNDAPVAVDDSGPDFNVPVNSSDNELNVLANDTDVDPGDTATLSLVSFADVTNAGATLELGDGGACQVDTICYTPPPAYTDVYIFDYVVQDTTGATDTGTVTVGGTDTDGDGVIDHLDNCDLVQNAGQEDNDGDGSLNGGDACDTDDDNDGMTDVFENTYNGVNGCALDPFDASDATEDCDGDGVINAEDVDPTVDDVGPIFSGVQNITVDATGYLTPVDLGNIRAVDGANGAVVITVDGVTGSTSQSDALNGMFRPGRTQIERSADDALGNLTSSTQVINVWPLADFAPNQITVEGNTGVIARVFLNGEAPDYPVTLDYTVSGSSTASDHNAVSGTLTIASGLTGVISIDFADDGPGEGNETLVLTLSNPVNAVLGGRKVHRITIAEGNVAPSVSLSVQQGSNDGALVTDNVGMVVVTASVSDPNAGDTASFNWSGTPAGTPAGATFTFDPLIEDLGGHSVAVEVTDSGGATVSAEVFLYLIAASDLPTFIADTDSDSFSDVAEGYSDDDSDGIPNFLDAYEQPGQSNLIQNQVGDSSVLFPGVQLADVRLIQTEPGLGIRKGPVAMHNNASGIMVSEDDVMEYANAYNVPPSSGADHRSNIGGLFDFEVYGLLPGATARVTLPLSARILGGAVYRKFSLRDGWRNFSNAGNNAIASARGVNGVCPAPGHEAYRNGLHIFDDCVELTLVDGGPNDADGEANGVIRDPGGVAVNDPSPGPEQEEAEDGSGGGVLHPFWLLLLMLWGGLRIARRQQSGVRR